MCELCTTTTTTTTTTTVHSTPLHSTPLHSTPLHCPPTFAVHSTLLSSPLHCPLKRAKATVKRTAPSVAVPAADRSKRARPSTPPPSTPDSSSSHSSAATESDGPLGALSDDFDYTSDSSHLTSSRSQSNSPPPLTPPLFDPQQCQLSRLPIFRERNIVSREAAAAAAETAAVPKKTESELEQLTVAQWLEYHLTHPKAAVHRKYLFSDEQYCTLLSYVTTYAPSGKRGGRLRV